MKQDIMGWTSDKSRDLEKTRVVYDGNIYISKITDDRSENLPEAISLEHLDFLIECLTKIKGEINES